MRPLEADALEQLQAGPTVLLWETEIRRILAGERAGAILRLGSASQYAESILSLSADRPLARTLFGEALRRVVESWEVSFLDGPELLANLLELLGVHTVSAAIPKVLLLARKLDAPTADVEKQAPSLKRLALHVLQRQFPGPLALPEFDEYVAVLRLNLAERSFCGYAATRLLALRVLRPASEEVREVLELNPMALREILPLYVNEAAGRFESFDDILALYRHCLLLEGKSGPKSPGMSTEADYLVLFRTVLGELGVDVEGDRIPVLRFHGAREALPILHEDHDLALYYQYNYEHLRVSSELKLSRLRAEAREEGGGELLPFFPSAPTAHN